MVPENKTTPEQCVYQTGDTYQKRSYRGLIAALIVAVILLIGVASVMGLINLQLFRKVLEQDPDQYEFRVTRVNTPEVPTHTEPTRRTPEGIPQLQLQPAAAREEPLPLQTIYGQTIDGVVSVIGQAGNGTGLVVIAGGYLVTDSSLLGDAQTAEIRFHSGSRLTARLVGADALTGLALLKTDGPELTPVTFCDDASVQVGDPVIAIGDPMGSQLAGTMTDGFISAINRDIEVDGRFVSLLQSTAMAGEGNSGGPLLNAQGQVIGINAAGLGRLISRSHTNTMGFAIPSSTVKEVVDQLLMQGYVSRRATLGFTVEQVSAFDQLYYKVPAGLYISAADPDVPVQPGDILLRFADQRLGDPNSLQQLLRGYHPGDTVNLTVYREGKELQLQLTLKEEE